MPSADEAPSEADAPIPRAGKCWDMTCKFCLLSLAAVIAFALWQIVTLSSSNATFLAAFTGDTAALVKAMSEEEAAYGILKLHRDAHGNTLAHWAAKGGQTLVIQLLLSQGLSVASKNGQGTSPLHWAAAGGKADRDLVSLLVQHGGSVASTNQNSETPLHWATGFHSWGIVPVLLGLGADPNARDTEGRTAAHWLPPDCVDMDGCGKAVQALEQHGADFTLTDSSGAKALDAMLSWIARAWRDADGNPKKLPDWAVPFVPTPKRVPAIKPTKIVQVTVDTLGNAKLASPSSTA
jgi:uncharacterized protein